MENGDLINIIIDRFSQKFDDFKGLYLFGSRTNDTFTDESDYDIVLIFDRLNHEKDLRISNIITKIEYEKDIFIDYKLFTTTGSKSIDYIRKNINPIFIKEAIDNGLYYGRI
jgi:predicted nucleotidyltransferase